MGAATIGALQILSSVDTSGLKKGLNSAAGDVSKFANGLGGAAGTLAGIGGGLSTAGVVLGLKEITSASVALVTDTTKAAARLGVTTQALSELRFAAKYTGVEAESLDKAIEKFSVHLGGVDEEGGKTAAALQHLGLDAKALAQQNPADALKTVATAFQKLPDQATKSAAAMALFGKGGVAILPFLDQGASGIEKLSGEARGLGVTIDDVTAKNVTEMTREFLKASDAILGLSVTILGKASPSLKEYAKDIQALVKEARTLPGTLGKFYFGLPQDFGAKNANLAAIDKVKNAGVIDKASADKRAAADVLALKGDVIDLERELKKEAETFGLTAGQTKLFELSQKGATAAQLEQATALVAQRKVAEESKKAQDELTASAKHFTESTRSPFAQYTEDLRKLDDLLAKGKITQDTFASAVEKSKTTYEATGRSLLDGLATPYEKVVLKITDLQKQLKEGTISEELFGRASKAAWKDLADAGKALAAPKLTPIEEYVKRRKELLKGLEEGTIDQKQFNRGIKEAHTDALEKGGGTEPKFASVAGDSAEARSMALKFQFGGEGKDPFGDLKKTGNEQVKYQASMVDVLKSIDKKLDNSGALPELDF